MAAPPTVSYTGLGFPGLLALVFIVLKLTHVIDWSWWWVLAPLWIGFSVFLFFVLVSAVALVIIKFFLK